jgi:hypothetical protein
MPEPRLETAALIGKGFCSDVYAWGEGRVLKLFHGRVAPDRAARKYAVIRAIHAAGIPSPAVYDLIEVEGRCGIVLERIDGASLLENPHLNLRPALPSPLNRGLLLFPSPPILASAHALFTNSGQRSAIPVRALPRQAIRLLPGRYPNPDGGRAGVGPPYLLTAGPGESIRLLLQSTSPGPTARKLCERSP